MSKFQIPTTQKVAVVPKAGGTIEIKNDWPVKQQKDLAPGECLVKIEASGCCHTDLHAALGDWPVQAMTPLIGGHEGKLKRWDYRRHRQQHNNSPVKLGERVGIKWLADSCLNCEDCRKGREQNCSQPSSVVSPLMELSRNMSSRLSTMSPPFPKASPVTPPRPSSGVTVYRAIKNSRTEQGDWIVIPGAYARARGLRVIAIDTGDHKAKLCKELGAEAWIDFKTSKDIVADVKKATGGPGAHSAVVTAASSGGYTQALDYLRPGATLMAVGLPGTATLNASIFFTVFKSISICGSYVGNRQDAREALELAARGQVKVHFVTKDLKELKATYDGLTAGTVAGRVVFDLTK
ncbi:NAD(P)-binding protein [Hymenopellis radicata]|nr:NAD(P)-binding protein [Hymenopellis radicata]